MKHIVILSLVISFSMTSFAQVAINTDGSAPNVSAMLDITSVNKGILIPRMADHTSVVSPAKGVLVFDTSTNTFWFWNGTAWTQIAAGGAGAAITDFSWNDGTNNLTITEDATPWTVNINNEADDLSDNIINDLSNVNASPSSGQILQWNGTNWVAADAGGGGGINWNYGFTYNSGTYAYDNPEDDTGAIYREGWVAIGKTDITYAASNDESKRALLQVGDGIGTDNFFNPNGGIIQIGSTEYIQDGGSNKFAVHGDWCPREDWSHNLGENSHRWSVVYAANGTINTSDRRLKKDIKTVKYGINAVMQLKPVTFNWKNKPYGHTHIGFIAQDLLETIPEVVQTHHYERVKENSDKRIKVKNETLGVYYSEIIPVLTKAIQEQQKIIIQLKTKLSNYEKRLSKIEKK